MTEPPPKDITIARVIADRSSAEFLCEDVDGVRWAVIPRGHETQSSAEPKWYAAVRVEKAIEEY